MLEFTAVLKAEQQCQQIVGWWCDFFGNSLIVAGDELSQLVDELWRRPRVSW